MRNYRIISSVFIIVLVALLTSPDATHAQDKATEADLEALGIKLKAAIASGEMTEEEALAEYEKAAGKMEDAKAGKSKGKDEENWKAPAINGLPCSPNVPEGIDPTTSVSFDSNYIMCIKVTMDPHDFDRLASETRFDGAGNNFEQIWPDCSRPWPSAYNWYRADIEIDGVSLLEVGIRKKGFVGSQYSPVPALKIKTDKYVKDQFLGNTERITLNNNGGFIPRMEACLTYEVFAAAGYSAPRCNMANVMVNGQPKGLYVHIEAIKKRFLRRAFGDNTGSLYEGTHTDFVEAWLPRWECKTSDTDTSYAPLVGVAQALQKPDDELIDALSPVLNIDRYITFWALEVLVSHVDGYGADRNNFYVYFDPTDAERAVFIPWGADKTFLGDFSLDGYLTADLPRRLSRIPAIATRMEKELERLLDEVWDEAALLGSIDRYSAQVKSAQRDDGYDTKVEVLRTWVRSRPNQVREMLRLGLPVGMEESLPCTNERANGK